MRKVVRDELLEKLKKAGAIVESVSPYLETVVEAPCHETKKSKKKSRKTRR